MTTFVLKFVFLQTIDQKFGCYFFFIFCQTFKDWQNKRMEISPCFIYIYHLVKDWGEWYSGLRYYNRIRRVLVQTPLGICPGLVTQPHYEASCDLWIKIVKTQWLISNEWGCPLDNGPKLAVGWPNSSSNRN